MFNCFPRQSSTTFSMTLPGAMSLESAQRIKLSRTLFPGLRSSLTTRVTLAQLLIQSGLDFVNNRSDLGINIILFLNDIFFSCLCFISLFSVVLVLALLCAPSTKGLLSDNLPHEPNILSIFAVVKFKAINKRISTRSTNDHLEGVRTKI